MRIAVIGGGITGMFASYYLSRVGHEVTLVTDQAGPADTSMYNGGFITPSFSPAPPIGLAKVASTMFGAREALYISPLEVLGNPAWFYRAAREGVTAHEEEVLELGSRSLGLYVSFFDEEGLQPGRQVGIIGLYKDPEDAKRIARKFDERFVPQEEVASMGYIGFGGGVLAEREISINPPQLCDELRGLLVRKGVVLKLGEKAKLSGKKDGAVKASLGADTTVDAEVIVVTSGSMSKEVLAPLGYDPRVLPARGLALLYDAGGKKIVPQPTLFEDYGIAVAQHDPDTVRVTSFYEMTGYKEEFAQARIDWLQRTVRSHLPALGELKLKHQGTGFRPCTPDQLPVIGKVPGYSNLFVATGNCRLGVTLAPVSGYILSSLVDGKQPEGVPYKLFDPARFA
jgi:D-amino-acid dehydrogenase